MPALKCYEIIIIIISLLMVPRNSLASLADNQKQI